MSTPTTAPAVSNLPDIPDVVIRVRREFASGRTRDRAWREEQLRNVIRLLDEQEDQIAAALADDLGRSRAETWFGDISTTRGEAVFALKHLRRWMRRRRQPLPLVQRPGSAWVQYEPLGVVLVIGAWNYPVYLTLSPLVAALAAGNCAVLKPSELAPVTSALLARLVPEYLDSEAVVVVEGDAPVTQELLAQGFDHVLFTGGTEIGKKIMAAAAPTLTPVTLELGGKSPVIVTADADLDVAARRIAWIKCGNSGQTCIAPDYVLADHRIRDRLVDKVVSAIELFEREGNADGRRIVNERQFARLVAYLAQTRGTIVLGGRVSEASLSIEPTVIVDPDPADAVMQEEIFGPILPVLSYESLDGAISFVNSRPKPLAGYYFTKSTVVGERLVDEIPSGGAVINHVAMHCLVPQLPFGGVGASGMGAYHGQWGFEALSHRKAVLRRTFHPDLQLIYPPYSERTLQILRKIF
ncbi:aldehyde dehydrogenase family protein [Nocardia gamkensis]|uniref:Aldehyde dehydrogenase n=1 Tax=Nocardia gamkensis TaxID=352869 RepID=A0A7X6KZA1_9NOCA|nr:aldehyde dehydrogenase family protein [Nocardia gamkensis]NKY24936.1 aldehyde dehydrogenase family protein [Nocardia gamkensis]NQE66715.1 Aldehyde dehydrogenase, dimeric NADP-preferring [Nocardia gamkensis]